VNQNEYTGIALGTVAIISLTIAYYVLCITLELATVFCPGSMGPLIACLGVCFRSVSRKRLEEARLRAQRDRGGGGDGGKGGARHARSSFAGDMSVNPWMMRNGGAGAAGDSDALFGEGGVLDAAQITGMRERPTPAMWAAIQASYGRMHSMLQGLQSEAADLKRELQTARGGGVSLAPAGKAAGGAGAVAARSRTNFKQRLQAGRLGGGANGGKRLGSRSRSDEGESEGEENPAAGAETRLAGAAGFSAGAGASGRVARASTARPAGASALLPGAAAAFAPNKPSPTGSALSAGSAGSTGSAHLAGMSGFASKGVKQMRRSIAGGGPGGGGFSGVMEEGGDGERAAPARGDAAGPEAGGSGHRSRRPSSAGATGAAAGAGLRSSSNGGAAAAVAADGGGGGGTPSSRRSISVRRSSVALAAAAAAASPGGSTSAAASGAVAAGEGGSKRRRASGRVSVAGSPGGTASGSRPSSGRVVTALLSADSLALRNARAVAYEGEGDDEEGGEGGDV
jgi:hypothetical protein